MRKLITLQSLIITSLIVATPVFAQAAGAGDVSKIENFIHSIVTMLVTLGGSVAALFLVLGGFRYITSSGNPEALEGAKKTLVYSAGGLVLVIAAFFLSNLVLQTAQGAFGQ